MKVLHLLYVLIVLFTSCQSNKDSNTLKESTKNMNSHTKFIEKTDAEWKKELSPEQYHILRENGTEAPHTGKYNLHFENGNYYCAGCNQKLFNSEAKFRSNCGWPSFDEAIAGSIAYKEDNSHGMHRTEIRCTKCNGHIGHVFNDGPTETGKRYCVNSISIQFNTQK